MAMKSAMQVLAQLNLPSGDGGSEHHWRISNRENAWVNLFGVDSCSSVHRNSPSGGL
jgi:hypothetical protein